MPTERTASDAERATEIRQRADRGSYIPPEEVQWLLSDRAAMVKRVEELEEENDRMSGPDSDALEVLCRVFEDGADAGFAEWQAWYKPSEWLHPSRALGAFIYGRLLAKRAFTPFEREAIDSLSQAMQAASGRVDGDGKVHVTITMGAANGIMHALSAALSAPAEEPSR